MNGLVLFLLLAAAPARAERASGAAGGGALSVASGDAIFVVSAPSRAGAQISLRRLAPDGGILWEQRYGRGQGEEATALAVSPDGGVLLAGAKERGCFLARFDGQGRLMGESGPGAGWQCRPAGVVVDGEHNAYLLATLSGSDGFDAIVWKIERWGSALWSYRYDRPGSVYALNLYLDPRGDRVRSYVQRSLDGRFSEEFFRLDLDGRVIN